MPDIHSNASPEWVDALRDILDRLAGTPLERTGDIVIELPSGRYAISQQDGDYIFAKVDRP